MGERVSRAQRVRMQSVAEREIMRFASDHAKWHYHVHGVELDPMQVLKCIEMDQHRYTVDFSCRRTGKTAGKEMWLLKDLACNPDQELGVIAPRQAQAVTNLSYHTDAIRRSEILKHYIQTKQGRYQISDTRYQFCNRSIARADGIMAEVDGGDLTMADLEEVDDMPADRLYSRFLLQLGANRRLGASREAKNDPAIRITGVYKGADTLARMVSSGQYHVLPTVDAYLGMEMGILNQAFLDRMREELTPDEYIRQLLCRNVSAKNLIWEKYVRRAMQVGLMARLSIVEPLPDQEHVRRGLVSFGYDAGGHGEDPHSSRHAFVVAEQIGNWVHFPFVRTWSPTADDGVVKRDLISFWRYFYPDFAMGDAYAVGMLTQLNDELFAEGLTRIDRRAVGDGESSASTWPEWAFSPLRFEGMTKHQMASALRSVFHNEAAVLPYIDDYDTTDTATADMRSLIRQLTNVKPETSKASYPRYKMSDPKIGDDCFDAAMAAVWGLATRGAAEPPGVVLSGVRSREQVLIGAA